MFFLFAFVILLYFSCFVTFRCDWCCITGKVRCKLAEWASFEYVCRCFLHSLFCVFWIIENVSSFVGEWKDTVHQKLDMTFSIPNKLTSGLILLWARFIHSTHQQGRWITKDSFLNQSKHLHSRSTYQEGCV